ncbi:thermostable hemolysin [Aestuariirhabdus litorea]|uniref:Thermostable hemolysin n=1 Tax=Aestuariirhabdus litorea TaxID=2528527 RepID=A0A3P3VMN0_9GAMM|nr:thermostable hemolysin [Aestuariirhabdus litorea]RRJ84022.1 hypothetical protein D0544_02570 [Aestuariirhabdus litorea]RWW97242.1 hypothetical protein DZC74_02565 [Endozoicomonadaceae bacterium GTF-13]
MLALRDEGVRGPGVRPVLIENPANQALIRRFIQRSFRERYGAHINVYSRHLLSLVDHQGGIRAAMGYQDGAEGPLFLEQYLGRPIERLLAEHTGKPVDRAAILEVGNLASTSGGRTRQLITALAPFFCARGYEWLVVTATPAVLNAFHRMGVGIELIPLAAASADALGKEAQCWGSYYNEEPVVVAGRLRKGLRRLLTGAARGLVRQWPQPQTDHQITLQEINA